jgi:dienelactone hydrolase
MISSPPLATAPASQRSVSLASAGVDFDPVKMPLRLALGTQDSLLGMTEVEQIKELMEKKQMQSEVRLYEDQVHGFALRGDWSSEKDKKAMDDAEKQGLEWFGKHLG